MPGKRAGVAAGATGLTREWHVQRLRIASIRQPGHCRPQRSRRLTQVCSFELTQRLQPYGVDHCRRLWRVGAASVVVPFRASRPWAAAALVGT